MQVDRAMREYRCPGIPIASKSVSGHLRDQSDHRYEFRLREGSCPRYATSAETAGHHATPMTRGISALSVALRWLKRSLVVLHNSQRKGTVPQSAHHERL